MEIQFCHSSTTIRGWKNSFELIFVRKIEAAFIVRISFEHITIVINRIIIVKWHIDTHIVWRVQLRFIINYTANWWGLKINICKEILEGTKGIGNTHINWIISKMCCKSVNWRLHGVNVLMIKLKYEKNEECDTAASA